MTTTEFVLGFILGLIGGGAVMALPILVTGACS
jgi:hypothetical protein